MIVRPGGDGRVDRRSVTDDEPNDSVIEIPAGLEQESTVVSVGRTMNRRTLLRTVGWVAAAAAAGVAVVEIVRRGTSSTVGVVTEALSFRRPSSPAPALAAGIHPNLVGLAPAVTPNADFFQIDTSMAAPDIDTGTWAFTIDGRVDHPLTLTYAELLALPSIERHITLACVSQRAQDEAAALPHRIEAAAEAVRDAAAADASLQATFARLTSERAALTRLLRGAGVEVQ